LLLGLRSEEFNSEDGERDMPVGVLGRPSREWGEEDKECLRRSSIPESGFSSLRSAMRVKISLSWPDVYKVELFFTWSHKCV